MQPALFLAIAAFVICLALTPSIRHVSRQFGIVDPPDGVRKVHRSAIPRTGGIAILIAYVAAVALLFLTPWNSVANINRPLVLGLVPAVGIIFLTGLLDDLVGLGPFKKLIGQVVAACVAYWAGVQVLGFAGISASGWISLPVTVFWLVLCANAFNLIDGIDGLASGMGLVAASTMLFASTIDNNLPLALAIAPLVGALLAFLRYNFSPASIFLGDCGSLTIGFLLGCYGAIWSHKATTLMGVTAPLMALSVPLVDTGLAVVRRYLRHQPIFAGDRNHIHHRLLDRGFSPREVAFGLCGIGALAAAFALVQTATHSSYGGIVVVVFGGATWVAVRFLRYVEFETARYLASTGVLRHILNVQVGLIELESRLSAALTVDDYWRVVRDASLQFGFASVRMRLAGALYEEPANARELDQCCRTQIPLGDGDYVDLAHRNGSSVERAVVVSSLSELIERTARSRARHFQPSPAPAGATTFAAVDIRPAAAADAHTWT